MPVAGGVGGRRAMTSYLALSPAPVSYLRMRMPAACWVLVRTAVNLLVLCSSHNLAGRAT